MKCVERRWNLIQVEFYSRTWLPENNWMCQRFVTGFNSLGDSNAIVSS